MKKIVLSNSASHGWTVVMQGISGMPDNTELPLPFTYTAPLAMVAADMRRRFNGAVLFYRDRLGHVSHCGV